MNLPELHRPVRVSDLSRKPKHLEVVADADERDRLARRFDLLELPALSADLTLAMTARGIELSGSVVGDVVQACALTGAPVRASISERVDLVFVDGALDPEQDDVELEGAELDVLPLEGGAVDVGEVVAQTMGLALDPYPKAEGAELAEARQKLTDEADLEAERRQEKAASNPFRILAGGKSGAGGV